MDGRRRVSSSSTALRARSASTASAQAPASASASSTGGTAKGCARGARDGRPPRGGDCAGSAESSAHTCSAWYAQIPWITRKRTPSTQSLCLKPPLPFQHDRGPFCAASSRLLELPQFSPGGINVETLLSTETKRVWRTLNY